MRILKAVLLAVIAMSPVVAQAIDTDGWYADRVARYATYQAAHHDAWRAAARRVAKIGKAGIGADQPIALWDGPAFPEMVAVPPGDYMMGSPPSEPQRRADEGPAHRVRIGHAIAVGKYAVTVAEFERFVAATGYDAGNVCKTFEAGEWQERPGRNWRSPGFAQTILDPVVCLNWNDAQAYVAWLAKATRRPYRLLSEAEFEYVNRAGTTMPYWWGSEVGGNHMNCNACDNVAFHGATVPVGSFPPNPFGLYDTTGNAWSWVSDCLNASYDGVPSDGSPNLAGDCGTHMLRGGAWYYVPGNLRSAIRTKDVTGLRNYHNGVRVAVTL